MIICIFIIRPKDVDLKAMEQTRHLLHPGITLPGNIAVKFPARRSVFRSSAELSFHVNDSLANFLELSLLALMLSSAHLSHQLNKMPQVSLSTSQLSVSSSISAQIPQEFQTGSGVTPVERTKPRCLCLKGPSRTCSSSARKCTTAS